MRNQPLLFLRPEANRGVGAKLERNQCPAATFVGLIGCLSSQLSGRRAVGLDSEETVDFLARKSSVI